MQITAFRHWWVLALAVPASAGVLYARARRLSSTLPSAVRSPHSSIETHDCAGGFIEDFEQPLDGILPKCEGRSGAWYGFKDQGPRTFQSFRPYVTAGENRPGHAGRALGLCEGGARNATLWGAGFGFDLNASTEPPNTKLPFDAKGREYTGIRFVARSGSSRLPGGATTVVSIRFPDINTDPVGGRCKTCWDDYSYSINLDHSWRSYTIRWTDLVHVGNGEPSLPFAANGILSIQWRLLPGDVFDIYVDDIEFIRY